MISPSFFTPEATKNAAPFFATLICPWFTTNVGLAPGFCVKLYLPARKSPSSRLKVVAMRLPTSTFECGPNKMPLGLTKNTRPLAISSPRIDEGSTPVTRFSATASALGWRNFTSSLTSMLKSFQLMMADWEL